VLARGGVGVVRVGGGLLGSCSLQSQIARCNWRSLQIEFCWNWDPGEGHRDDDDGGA